MSKKKQLKLLSISYQIDDDIHYAITAKNDEVNNLQLDAECRCGEERCINGVKYRCMRNFGGECVWFKTTESCKQIK